MLILHGSGTWVFAPRALKGMFFVVSGMFFVVSAITPIQAIQKTYIKNIAIRKHKQFLLFIPIQVHTYQCMQLHCSTYQKIYISIHSDGYFFPHSRARLPTFRTNCPDGSLFAQISIPNPCSLLSPIAIFPFPCRLFCGVHVLLSPPSEAGLRCYGTGYPGGGARELQIEPEVPRQGGEGLGLRGWDRWFGPPERPILCGMESRTAAQVGSFKVVGDTAEARPVEPSAQASGSRATQPARSFKIRRAANDADSGPAAGASGSGGAGRSSRNQPAGSKSKESSGPTRRLKSTRGKTLVYQLHFVSSRPAAFFSQERSGPSSIVPDCADSERVRGEPAAAAAAAARLRRRPESATAETHGCDPGGAEARAGAQLPVAAPPPPPPG